jgi:hypothetical protein
VILEISAELLGPDHCNEKIRPCFGVTVWIIPLKKKQVFDHSLSSDLPVCVVIVAHRKRLIYRERPWFSIQSSSSSARSPRTVPILVVASQCTIKADLHPLESSTGRDSGDQSSSGRDGSWGRDSGIRSGSSRRWRREKRWRNTSRYEKVKAAAARDENAFVDGIMHAEPDATGRGDVERRALSDAKVIVDVGNGTFPSISRV